MTRKLLTILTCAAFLIGGCREYAYYQSAFHANTSSYKAMPLSTDSLAATYVSGAIFTGGSGDRLRDGYWVLNGNLYRGHSFGAWRGFYGLSGSIGSYRVRPLNYTTSFGPETKYPNDSIISARSGSKFFAGLGGSAGIYAAMPFEGGGEWRVLGAELNYMHEFGRYWTFRNKLPDTAANLISRPRSHFSIGMHSDVIFNTRRGNSGFKIGAVFNARIEKRFSHDGKPANMLPGYYSFTYHYSRDRVTGFWQTNLGTYTANIMVGFNYRLR